MNTTCKERYSKIYHYNTNRSGITITRKIYRDIKTLYGIFRDYYSYFTPVQRVLNQDNYEYNSLYLDTMAIYFALRSSISCTI